MPKSISTSLALPVSPSSPSSEHLLTFLQIDMRPSDHEDLANAVLLAALMLYAASLTTYVSTVRSWRSYHRKLSTWILGGILADLALGIISSCGLHTAMLDFMPWTVLAAILLGCSIGNRGHDAKRSESEEDEGELEGYAT